MSNSKTGSAQRIGRVLLPQDGVVFSGKRYTDSAVDLLFKKMRPRTPAFQGVLMAEAEEKRLYLIIVDNEPYAAGEEQQGIFVPLMLHGFFSQLHRMSSAALTLSAADPLFLKALLTVIQRAPTTDGTTDLMEIGGVLQHLKKTPTDQLLVVGKQSAASLFYFREGALLSGYSSDPAWEKAQTPIEERLLAFVNQGAGGGPLTLAVFSPMAAAPAEDGMFERGKWPDDLVAHFTRPVPHLLIVGSDGVGRRYELSAPTVTMGRSDENDLVVDDPAISRRHLVFRQEPQGYSVEDCGSRNGTLHNGAPLKRTLLTQGTELQIGACLIRFFGETEGTDHPSETGSGEETICRPAAPAQPAPAPAAVAPSPTWVIDIVRADGSHERLPLKPRITTIGRSKADLVLVDTRVSRRHGELEVGAEAVTYRDTGSTNGSLLNGRAVTSAVLKPGDVLKLGETSLTLFSDAA